MVKVVSSSTGNLQHFTKKRLSNSEIDDCTYITTRSSSSYLPALSRNGSETGVLYDAHNVDPLMDWLWQIPPLKQVDLKALTCYWIDLLRVCAVELHCIPIRLFILILDT